MGQEITVDGVDDYTVAVYAYSSSDNDFTFTVDDTAITWSEANGRNLTAGFDIERTESGFTISYGSINNIISKAQGGASVETSGFPEDMDLFRLTVLADDGRVDMYFHVVPFIDIVLDITEVII